MVHRSKITWGSLRRLEFIEDMLIDPGHFQRADVANYFACDPSLVSFDLKEYANQGGKYEIRIGTWRDGVFQKESPRNGAGKWFFPIGDFAPVLNSTPIRVKAWDLIAVNAKTNAAWFDEVMLMWADDHPDADAAELMEYFGVTRAVADGVLGYGRDAVDEARAKVWEVWG